MRSPIIGLAIEIASRGITRGRRIARNGWRMLMVASFAVATPAAAELEIKGGTGFDIESELQCLALNIYFEARSESEAGKRAVGHVVMNRVVDPRFPGWVCEVVRQGGEWPRNRCQFSWWCDGLSDKPRDQASWNRSWDAAYQVYWGYSEDPTDGALWYHAVYVKPAWRKLMGTGKKIGRHIFYSKSYKNVVPAPAGPSPVAAHQ